LKIYGKNTGVKSCPQAAAFRKVLGWFEPKPIDYKTFPQKPFLKRHPNKFIGGRFEKGYL
jgi:hypothetical protein